MVLVLSAISLLMPLLCGVPRYDAYTECRREGCHWPSTYVNSTTLQRTGGRGGGQAGKQDGRTAEPGQQCSNTQSRPRAATPTASPALEARQAQAVHQPGAPALPGATHLTSSDAARSTLLCLMYDMGRLNSR